LLLRDTHPGTQAPKPVPAASTAAAGAAPPSATPPKKVLMELFIMSYCPDAYSCVNYLEPVVRKLSPIVHVRTE
jgi:hypothetical protein